MVIVFHDSWLRIEREQCMANIFVCYRFFFQKFLFCPKNKNKSFSYFSYSSNSEHFIYFFWEIRARSFHLSSLSRVFCSKENYIASPKCFHSLSHIIFAQSEQVLKKKNSFHLRAAVSNWSICTRRIICEKYRMKETVIACTQVTIESDEEKVV